MLREASGEINGPLDGECSGLGWPGHRRM